MIQPTSTSGTKRSVAIFEDLQARILRGEFSVGERLPPERELAQAYEITRNTLREAVRALEREQLVTVRQGQGVTVSDFRRTGTLALLAPFLVHGADPAERALVLLDALVARAEVLTLAVSLVAERAQPGDFECLEASAALQRTALASKDAAALARGEIGWMNALLDAAHSVTVRWIANSFLDVYEAIITRMPSLWVMDPGYIDWLDGLLAAFRDRDPARAAELTNAYFERTDTRLRQMLEPMAASQGPAEDVTDG